MINIPVVQNTISPTQQTENMETHANHLHHAPGKKSWHYLYEFLMLFLAVFCGFLAENEREHMVEHQREKQYMKSMLTDLRADISFINDDKKYAETSVEQLGSMQKNLYSDSIFQKTVIIYQQYADYFHLLTPHFNDQTITQLRSSGNVRLIRNNEIATKLAEYWNQINWILKTADRIEQRLDVSAQMAATIFNRKYLLQQKEDTITGNKPISIDPAAKFMTNDKNQLTAFANLIDRIKTSINLFYIPYMQSQKQKAIQLIDMIKKEYELE